MLNVVILSAHIPPEKADQPNTFVVGTFRDVERSTRVVQKDQNPSWNENLMWYLDAELLDSSSFATVQLLECGAKIENRDFGTATISLAAAAKKPNVMITKKNQNLLDKSEEPTGSTITVKLCFSPPEEKKLEARRKYDGKKFICCPVFARPSGIDELGPKDTLVTPVPTTPLAPVRELPNKKQPFQVRVVIIECRQLQENNLKPVVKVLIGDYSFRTRIRMGNNPYYNETFVQNFNETPLRLFDQFITILVLNSRAVRADTLVGVFKIEMGLIYESAGHALVSKWLSLYDPANLNAGFKGYVKVTLCVLAAGDRAPDTDHLQDIGDLESNLLQLSSVPGAHMVTLQLYIYRAEDVPQIQEDTLPKNPTTISVDPSLEVNFAGKLLRTKVVLGETNPVWNQLLTFPTQMPPICDLIKFTLMDGMEEGDGNTLGTAFISLSQISCTQAGTKKSSSGFLPCFGPTFLTFYGMPKEFTSQDNEFQKPTTGTVEGITYSGRVLVELRTTMDATPFQKIDNIPEETLKKMQRFLPRRRYGLGVIFYSATMLPEISERIQFEVSIGNYGNRFDETCKPCASTTQYNHAIYDGNYYYYLPWYDTKPMVAVNSFWEDVDFRIACTHTIEVIHLRLKMHLDALKAISDPHDPLVGVAWKKLQKELIEDCKKPFPALESQKAATVLDQQLWKQRARVFQKISKAAEKTRWKTPLQKLIAKVEGWLNQLASVMGETQISIPDVLIWMLCDDRHVAYSRVKASSIMFSDTGPYAKGRLCGKTQTIFLQYLQSKEMDYHIPAVLRVRMWLGQVTGSADFIKCCEGNVVVYAETYENQKKTHGIWGTMDLLPHPNFSDVTGQVSLPKDKFQPPPDWQWEGEWIVEPQRRLLLDKETNHTEVLEEVFENQSRQPGRRWKQALIPYSKATGKPSPPKEDIVCPQGWVFVEEWRVEMNRAVDDKGWEYGVTIPPEEMPHSWNAAEKTYHTHRRRRWLRTRFRNLGRENQEDYMASFLQLVLGLAPEVGK